MTRRHANASPRRACNMFARSTRTIAWSIPSSRHMRTRRRERAHEAAVSLDLDDRVFYFGGIVFTHRGVAASPASPFPGAGNRGNRQRPGVNPRPAASLDPVRTLGSLGRALTHMVIRHGAIAEGVPERNRLCGACLLGLLRWRPNAQRRAGHPARRRRRGRSRLPGRAVLLPAGSRTLQRGMARRPAKPLERPADDDALRADGGVVWAPHGLEAA